MTQPLEPFVDLHSLNYLSLDEFIQQTGLTNEELTIFAAIGQLPMITNESGTFVSLDSPLAKRMLRIKASG